MAAAAAKSGADDARRTAMEQRMTDSSKAIRTGDLLKAVQSAISDPPFGTKDKTLKADNFEIVQAAMLAARTDTEIQKVIDGLSMDECDLLMKFIYRGLESGTVSAQFLKWHAAALTKAGPSSIMRVITDKKSTV